MANQKTGASQSNRREHFDEPELGSGARDTGDDAPDPGQGDRPVGSVDQYANPPMSDPTASDVYGAPGSWLRRTPGALSRPTRGARSRSKLGGLSATTR